MYTRHTEQAKKCMVSSFWLFSRIYAGTAAFFISFTTFIIWQAEVTYKYNKSEKKYTTDSSKLSCKKKRDDPLLLALLLYICFASSFVNAMQW